ncbi:MAG: ATP-binding protein [Eubacteriales bacterium]|jgi:two-component system phosphate regulon sensor histidine kinase PhoR|nr:ATP-binding protein [Eubacteriales bacterium]
MKNRIFKGIFYVAILVWISCLVLILGALYSQYSGQYQIELKNEAHLVAQGINTSGDAFFKNLEVQDNHRITWIDDDGTVIYDSRVEAKKLENHGDRKEVISALKTGYGEEIRYSKTLSEKTVYCAVKLQDGTVLRVSATQFTLLTLILTMLQPILIVLAIAIVLSMILASRISKLIIKPINQIDVENPEKNKIYDELRPLVEKLSEQNKQITKQITELQVDVDEKTKESDFRREFTANVSHELKTPLTSISGFAEIIKNGIVKDQDIPRFAGKIYDEAQRLIALVGDIIKLSQLDENAILAKKERIDLYSTCESVIAHLQVAAQKKNIKFRLEGQRAEVDAVEQILEEIIYNLCDNAVKYNKENGSITVEVSKNNDRPYVKVTDTGIGIPENEIDRVFERFYRVNKSHSKEIGGTGLGLSIVKHGAAYHNAKISIESKVDKGTSITITF